MENGQPLRIVTVAFNPGEELANMAASLAGATVAAHELVIVDNGTEHAVVDAVARDVGATVLRSGKNVGYGSAANIGLAGARGEWGMIVNPDVVFGAGSIDAMFEGAKEWPRGGAFGPLIMTEENEVYPSARHFPRLSTGIGHAVLFHIWPGNPFTRAYRRNSSIDAAHPVDWLSGACLLVRMEAFTEVEDSTSRTSCSSRTPSWANSSTRQDGRACSCPRPESATNRARVGKTSRPPCFGLITVVRPDT